MDIILVVAIGFVVWFTLNSALNPYNHPPPPPKDDWLDRIQFVSPYTGKPFDESIELSSVGSSRRKITQMECEDEA